MHVKAKRHFAYIQIQHLLKLNTHATRYGDSQNKIQIQHLLKLNRTQYKRRTRKHEIQIQHLLKLNAGTAANLHMSLRFKYNTC